MSRQTLTTLAVVVTASLFASSAALAGGCHKGGGYYKPAPIHHKHRVVHRPHVVVHKPIVHEVVIHKPVVKHVDHCHHPKFCLAYVCPGETLPTICAREYGNPNFWTKVAEFNGMPLNAPLIVGQPLKLPRIYDSGRMVLSTAPAPPAPAIAVPSAPVAVPTPGPVFRAAPGPQVGPQLGQPPVGPQGQPMQQLTAPVQPVSNTTSLRQVEQSRPLFAVGSQVALNGQAFGGVAGQVQLSVGGMSLQANIVSWTPSEVMIQLPELPLAAAADARLMVLSADGQMITQSELRLMPTSSRLAMGN